MELAIPTTSDLFCSSALSCSRSDLTSWRSFCSSALSWLIDEICSWGWKDWLILSVRNWALSHEAVFSISANCWICKQWRKKCPKLGFCSGLWTSLWSAQISLCGKQRTQLPVTEIHTKEKLKNLFGALMAWTRNKVGVTQLRALLQAAWVCKQQQKGTQRTPPSQNKEQTNMREGQWNSLHAAVFTRADKTFAHLSQSLMMFFELQTVWQGTGEKWQKTELAAAKCWVESVQSTKGSKATQALSQCLPVPFKGWTNPCTGSDCHTEPAHWIAAVHSQGMAKSRRCHF